MMKNFIVGFCLVAASLVASIGNAQTVYSITPSTLEMGITTYTMGMECHEFEDCVAEVNITNPSAGDKYKVTCSQMHIVPNPEGGATVSYTLLNTFGPFDTPAGGVVDVDFSMFAQFIDGAAGTGTFQDDGFYIIKWTLEYDPAVGNNNAISSASVWQIPQTGGGTGGPGGGVGGNN